MDQVQVLKAEDFFCIPFVNLHFRLNSTVQLWFCASFRPPAVKRIMFSRPGEFWNADEVHNHSSMCRTESDTWTTSRSPCLLLLPGEQLLDSREPLDTHTFLIQLLLILTHTTSITGGVSERECSICLSASWAIHHLYGWRQARWIFFSCSVLYSWTLPFCYCTSVCPRRHPLWSVLHFAFFHRKPWRVSRSNDQWIFCFHSRQWFSLFFFSPYLLRFYFF